MVGTPIQITKDSASTTGHSRLRLTGRHLHGLSHNTGKIGECLAYAQSRADQTGTDASIVRTAEAEDLDDVIDTLAECSSWLNSKGIVQWPEHFARAQLLPNLDAGDLYVVDGDTFLAATFTLQWSDPMFWGDRADARFLHRLGVRRSHAGLGSDILRWTFAEARSRGRQYLCLDCLSTNHDSGGTTRITAFRSSASWPGLPAIRIWSHTACGRRSSTRSPSRWGEVSRNTGRVTEPSTPQAALL